MSDASGSQGAPRPMGLGNYMFSFSAPAAPSAPSPPNPTPQPPVPTALPASPQPKPGPPGPGGEAWVLIEHFLPPPMADQILATFIAHEADFRTAQTNRGVTDYRQSLEIPPTLPIFRAFEAALSTVLPHAANRLGYGDVPIQRVDVGGNAYPNGGLFKRHYDNASSANASRLVSYVYYLHRQPKPFHGGDLVLYPERRGILVKTVLKVVEPTHNSLIFFRSDQLHEVLPVIVPSGHFADSRFTINGWAHRGAPNR